MLDFGQRNLKQTECQCDVSSKFYVKLPLALDVVTLKFGQPVSQAKFTQIVTSNDGGGQLEKFHYRNVFITHIKWLYEASIQVFFLFVCLFVFSKTPLFNS